MKEESNNQLWKLISQKSCQIEKEMNVLERKRTGSYYTSLELTDFMMEELAAQLFKKTKRIEEYKFLEPCVGTGHFVFSYLKVLYKYGVKRETAQKVINNIYVADINKSALEGYKDSLEKVVDFYWKIRLDADYFETHLGTGLLVDITASELKYLTLQDAFGNQFPENYFDIVVTNPPYKNLKAERSQYENDGEYAEDKEKYTAIMDKLSRFRYSVDGVLNLYKLFVEEIVDRYARKEAFVSLLIPSSILTDKTCTRLRTHLLKDMNLLSVKEIPENSGFIDAQQALCTVLIQKGNRTRQVEVAKNILDLPKGKAIVQVEDILSETTGNAIFAINDEEYIILKKLRKFPTVKELRFIANLRGELDLTLNKESIVLYDTGYPLLRGRNIGYYNLTDRDSKEYVLKEFTDRTAKRIYIEKERIACQQIANMKKERRVTFSLVPEKCVLGNSCNFISVAENKYGIDNYTLLGLFNTKLMNWFFKLTSSNNHINNYEIDNFPVPVEAESLKSIAELARQYVAAPKDTVLEEIERLAYTAYGLDAASDETTDKTKKEEKIALYLKDIHFLLPDMQYEDAKKILNQEKTIEEYGAQLEKFAYRVAEGITDKYIKLYHGYLLNHTTFKLSELDLEMIRHVPQGGSWKNIPRETVEKSKRLKRITQTGGRTTLYGRIDYDKPSYTITTYFNRPGNGTYVHPVHERVLTVREAARFQTFQDDYYFYGNKTQLLKQVGNAVPTLLAYQIGKRIREKTDCSKSIDLFCGAGGMTAGFKAAGITSLISNDIEESACITLKINNPEIKVLCGDITQADIKDKIAEIAKKGNADIICGGPPCQGFSMAGFRADNDARNQLFREFVDIVDRVKPKVIVFENVEGLLSYQGGKTYREVHTLFAELGYNTEGRTLMANEYAVPQKRKRVIIICTRKDMSVSPSELFPLQITQEEAVQITARDTIADLEQVSCDEQASYCAAEESHILRFFKNKITYEEYVQKYSEPKAENTVLSEADGQLVFQL